VSFALCVADGTKTELSCARNTKARAPIAPFAQTLHLRNARGVFVGTTAPTQHGAFITCTLRSQVAVEQLARVLKLVWRKTQLGNSGDHITGP
jgi:hypothetical protein